VCIMKIAYIYQFLTLGGVCAQLLNRFEYFQQRSNVEVSCYFLYDRGGRALLDRHSSITVNRSARALVGHALTWEPDFVVSIDTPQVMRFLDQNRRDACWVNEIHTTTRIAAYVDSLSRYSALSGCIVPSEYMRQFVMNRSGLSESRMGVVPNGLDTEHFDCRPEPSSNRRVVCWVGKLDAHKNWKGFVEVAERIAERHSDVEFWIVGGDTAGPVVSRSFMERANRSPLGPRLRWIDRWEYDEMPTLYRKVAAGGGCLLITSTNESFGMTAMEAQACGCPVVSSDVGALPELVLPERTGLLYSAGDLNAAAISVSRILDDEALRVECVREGRLRVMACNNLTLVGQRYLDCLNRFRG
jgi:glycosyltransferase involved in cell wall biosynthesis